MYTPAEVDHALALLSTSRSLSEVSRLTGISRAAIRRWTDERALERSRARRLGTCLRCAGYVFPVPNITAFAYSYLVGLYFGDGSISSHPRGVYRLRVFLDSAYPGIVGECEAAISILSPANRVATARSSNCRMHVPSAYSRHWPCLFPQHGPGRKHERPIALEPWQREILDRYPWRFLRGLIHSDGSRHINTIKHPGKTYRYPRYEFSNRSADIRGLFCEYCDAVEVRWTRTNQWNISVARRESVALMDRHIGPKR